MTLKDLNIGETAVVGTVGGEGALRQHFLDMGLIPGEKVTLVKFAPMGDPMELSIHGYELTLRLDDAARIGVTLAKAPAAKKAEAESEKPVEHPGLGEGGRYHTKKGENLCAGGQPELRQDDPLQPAHRLQPARRQFPGRDGGPQERCDPEQPEYGGHRPARHLLHVALYQRGDRDPAVHHR